MKKVLFIHHGGSDGGAPRSLRYLINMIDSNEYKIYVLCWEQEGLKYLFSSPKINLITVSTKLFSPFHGSTVAQMNLKTAIKMALKSVPTYIIVRKIVKKIKPDIVHLNSTCLFVPAKAVKDVAPDTMVVCHVREPLSDDIYGDILRKYNKKYIDRFIAIDKYDAASLKFKPDYLKIIYNFVDFKIYNSKYKSSLIRNKLEITGKVVFLFLARVAKSNGALEMAKELYIHRHEHHNMHFIIAGYKGNSEYEKEVKAICDQIPFVSLLPFSNNVPEIIANSDVIVCPFVEPHFARAIIEGAAMGCPAIASDIGGPQELVQNGVTGFLFDKNDFSQFWEKCTILSKDSSLRIEMGKKAEDFAKENFNAEKNAKETTDVYLT